MNLDHFLDVHIVIFSIRVSIFPSPPVPRWPVPSSSHPPRFHPDRWRWCQKPTPSVWRLRSGVPPWPWWQTSDSPPGKACISMAFRWFIMFICLYIYTYYIYIYIWKWVGIMTFPFFLESHKGHVPNHQPVYIYIYIYGCRVDFLMDQTRYILASNRYLLQSLLAVFWMGLDLFRVWQWDGLILEYLLAVDDAGMRLDIVYIYIYI